jgi:hypothetical protein
MIYNFKKGKSFYENRRFFYQPKIFEPPLIISTATAGLCRYFPLSAIKHGTKYFDELQVVGVAGFGKVHIKDQTFRTRSS